jgi:predicted transcriptional regulator
MTLLFQKAVATVSALPDARQDQLALILMQLAGAEESAYALTEEEEADLDASLAEAARGEFASDAEIEAIWTRFRG